MSVPVSRRLAPLAASLRRRSARNGLLCARSGPVSVSVRRGGTVRQTDALGTRRAPRRRLSRPVARRSALTSLQLTRRRASVPSRRHHPPNAARAESGAGRRQRRPSSTPVTAAVVWPSRSSFYGALSRRRPDGGVTIQTAGGSWAGHGGGGTVQPPVGPRGSSVSPADRGRETRDALLRTAGAVFDFLNGWRCKSA